MKPIIQKLPLSEGTSFVARTYETPLYETPWHQHETVELMLSQAGEGSLFAGDYIGEFKVGDVYMFGKNLPHWFRKLDHLRGKTVVVQFKEDLFGQVFLNLPELSKIKSLLQISRMGLRLKGGLRKQIKKRLTKIESLNGYEQISVLLDCLHSISLSKEYDLLTNTHFSAYSEEEQMRISAVFDYTLNHFTDQIKLEQVANLTNQSVSNFCKYFKKNTKKTYIQFLNEVRISHTCKLLKNTDKTITEICYESGFRNWSNFSSQFKKTCGVSPSEYRSQFKPVA
ncbi:MULTISPECIES: AraC family transcriptional regulator [Flavobacteriaceae]|uniref:AraC family transcriptional regulator n=1 Tax=Flavobacteriaceae TaxID=49546 RepID=UPI001490CFB1|nr:MULTISPECIES: AraC family transcriptional regulator [Allomuricauda]MDC6367311.1 AraC family transcriptional regulator [Muricauda sp. AC10]